VRFESRPNRVADVVVGGEQDDGGGGFRLGIAEFGLRIGRIRRLVAGDVVAGKFAAAGDSGCDVERHEALAEAGIADQEGDFADWDFAGPEPFDRPPRVGGHRAKIEVVMFVAGGLTAARIAVGQVDRGRMIVVGRKGMVVDGSVGQQVGNGEIHGAKPPQVVNGRYVNIHSP
jgi:hypothetical protein